MKKSLLIALLFFSFSIEEAQERNVTGRVTTAESGEPIPGVSVLIQGTSSGTITDMDGNYNLPLTQGATRLIFSYLGYVSQEREIGNESVINVVLTQDIEDLSEVVVTAFGLEREKKALTYTTQSVSARELSEARELNVVNSLSGKVAGLSINRNGSGVGGASRVILRGNRSITGNSQVLYIVDGVPGGISNLNPDDIESINVLKGPNAAALYGSRANNGAIVVTTKKGSREGFNVSVNTSFMVDSPILLTNYQNEYGQGSAGVYSPASEFSWGPRMDGSSVAHWSRAEGAPSTYPFTAQPNNVRDVYQNGHNLATTLIISAGNEKNQTYFSYTYTDAAGVVPNNELGRHSLNLRLTNNLNDKLTLDAKVNYIRTDIDNQIAVGENFANPNRHIYRLPRNIRIQDLEQFEYTAQDGSVMQNYYNPGSNGGANPYWTLNRNLRYDRSDRIIGLSSLNYEPIEGLNIMGRVALDRSFGKGWQKYYNDSYIIAQNGRYWVFNSESMEVNADILASYDKSLSQDWHLNILAGANTRINRNSGLSSDTGAAGLTIPNFFALANTQQVMSEENVGAPKNVNSVLSNVVLGWKNAVFLELSARNDWSSALPRENWSFFYPSVGLNAVISDLIMMPEVFTFFKLRGSLAEVGNDTGAYQLHRTATLAAGGLGGYLSLSTTLPNENLLPETTRSLELGTDIRFFDNRLALDFTYYKTNSFDQLFTVALPVGSGASQFFTNGGNVQNEGVEAMLTITPIRNSNFNWDITTNFSRNVSLVKEINDERPSLQIGGDFLRQYWVEEGKPFGEIYSRGYLRDDQGRVVIAGNGIPMLTPGFTVRVGNYNPDWMGGIQNSFSYKNFRANFTIDIRNGGNIVSLSNAVIYADGLTEETLQGRDGTLIFGNNFMEHEVAVLEGEDGEVNDIATDAETFWLQMGGRNAPIGEVFTVSATNARLREAVVGYTFPASQLQGLPFKSIGISFVARNLFFLMNKAGNLDPDVTVGTGTAAEGFESFAPPTARSFGFNLNLGF